MNPSSSDNRILTITVSDLVTFKSLCEIAKTDPTIRCVAILLSEESCVEPGMASLLGSLKIPVVAGLSGRIDNGILELALAADVRVSELGTTFAMKLAQNGRLPSDGGSQRLPMIAGHGLATDMLLTGRRISAEEALRAGLVTLLVPVNDNGQGAARIAEEIAEHGQAAGKFTKEAVIEGANMSLDQSLHLEADLAILLHTDPERAEGIEAFKENRPPAFWSRDRET